jgi:4-amino-4-deoxy-L-arabinose transferase-like glycosyltransferase
MLVIFSLALAARVTWGVYADRQPKGLNDPWMYDYFADRIARGLGYTSSDGVPTAYYPVGYPATLGALYALVGSKVLAAKILNAFLGAATVCVTYRLAVSLLGFRIALVSGLLLALFPSQVYYSGTLLSEPLFTFLFMFGLLLATSGGWRAEGMTLRHALGLGILMGAAALVRGITMGIPVVMLIASRALFSSFRRALACAAVVAAGIVLFVLPWSVRSSLALGTPVLISTNVGDDLCIGNQPNSTGRFLLSGPCFEGYEGLDRKTLEVERNRDDRGRALKFMVTSPLSEGKLVLRKAYYLMYTDDDGIWAIESWGNDPFIELNLRDYLRTAANAYYFAALAFALVGVVLWIRRRDRRLIFLLLMLGYVLLIPLIFFGDPRFHFPAIPIISMLAASGLVSALRQGRPRGADPAGQGSPEA